MTLYEFTPPSTADLVLDQEKPLYRHYGALQVGHTIYFKDGEWHTLDEGYEPEVLDGADVVYLGGRVYQVTLQEYYNLFLGGFVPLANIGFYPGQYPGEITFPVSDPPAPTPSPGDDDAFYPGEDTYPGEHLIPEAP